MLQGQCRGQCRGQCGMACLVIFGVYSLENPEPRKKPERTCYQDGQERTPLLHASLSL